MFMRSFNKTGLARSVFAHISKPQFCRLYSSHQNAFADNTTSSKNTNQYNKFLFQWKNEVDLAKLLVSNIVYSDGGLIAISKPWGLGMHAAEQKIEPGPAGKSRAHHVLNTEIYGHSRFCLADVLDYIAQIIQVRKLHIVKSAYRDWSGLVLLSTSDELGQHVEKSIRRAKAMLRPHIRFYCITNGIAAKSSDSERCGIRLYELDELAEYKEPVYVPPEKMSHKMRKVGLSRKDVFADGSVKPVTVQYRTLAINRELAVSFVELQTSVTKWSFVQCFLAYKTAFVLGDTFFSHRVKHILGQPMVIQPKKIKSIAEIRNLDQGLEPLSSKVQRALGVQRNAQLPLMIHCSGLNFPGLRKSISSRKTQKPSIPVETRLDATATELVQPPTSSDIDISADQLHHLPPHFVHTLDCLDLNIFSQ